MLRDLEARARAAAMAAAVRVRVTVAERLRAILPGIRVEIVGDDVALVGRIDPTDPRLRWLASTVQ